ncbi:FixH family protein, partial [Pseudorhodobacter sp.]|uniref:FixH family protein n=1 Tax=Pseudorhodobacter sp. TaxID=1934400 RepID=UPI002648B4D4
MTDASEFRITGRKVAAFTVGAFGIIIAVNLVMAYKAVSTFPGLEVPNSYVASQEFDRAKAAQIALGWDLVPEYDAIAKELRLVFTDIAGLPADVASLGVLVGRTTEAREDMRPEFLRRGGAFVAPIDLHRGKWMLQVEARAKDG